MTDSHDLPARLETLAAAHDDLARRIDQVYRQVEALHMLTALIPLRLPLPPMRGYAISPDFAVILYTLVMTLRPRRLLELGGGVSTLVSAYALSESGGRVVSLDHIPGLQARTRQMVERHGLSACVEFVAAPLVPVTLGGETWDWYDVSGLDAGEPFDLLVVDGPPQYGSPRPQARYPALPLLRDRLSPGAHILMDDTARTDEAAIAARWEREFGLHLVERYDEAEKGAALYTLTG